MENNNHLIFTAKNIADILFQKKTVSNLELIGGATYILSLPEKSLCIRGIPELSLIDKHERYIDFGPAVTLNNILHMGINFLPSVLYEAISSISNYAVRNMATIGGNIMARDTRLTLNAPLIALGTTLKFRSQKNIDIIPLVKFTSIPADSILVNIRIPTDDWNIEIFRRLGPSNKISNESCSFCFLANTEKKVLINLKICFSGPFIFTSKELETRYLGTKLPLSNSTIDEFISMANKEFDEHTKDLQYNPIIKRQFSNLLAYSLHELT
ncbi:MAG: FAD binding domain-containing protein [Treponema sp.]